MSAVRIQPVGALSATNGDLGPESSLPATASRKGVTSLGRTVLVKTHLPAGHDHLIPGMNLTRAERIVVFIILAIGLGWAAYTAHVWEDYYITFRASKNLATGNGLVFTPGERVHSFTSPLGVLLPALTSLATLNASDSWALSLFRLVSVAALAGAAVFLWRIARHTFQTLIAALLMVGLFASDNKTIDYTVNGMETGLLLLFLAWTLWTVFTSPRHQRWHLGLSWAGLMWTRPDSCIYIAAIALGSLLFPPPKTPRRALLITYLQAGVITTLIYLPWFVWAWWYYGTPIPHTIKAKGLFHHNSLPVLTRAVLQYPQQLWRGETSLAATFVPPYGLETGWPPYVAKISLWVSYVPLVLWLIPRVRWETKVASFAFVAGHLYLMAVVHYPFPWYVPAIAALGIVSLALFIGQLFEWCARSLTGSLRSSATVTLWSTAIALVMASATLSGFTAYNLRAQQRIVETGNRQVLGLWLREHARSPRDTVFLEPLGYIGYFSGLKMLDFPGLCSPEVVAARLRAKSPDSPFCWPEIIRDLQPDWLVLRPAEAGVINQVDAPLLKESYRRVRNFDVSKEVAALPFMPGRGYLEYDAIFEVYQRIGAEHPAGQ